jgi:prepilin-type processing-associated H-X9-DG protein
MGVGITGYPDICAIECGNCAGWADWENCAGDVGACIYSYAPNDGSLLSDDSKRKNYTRHLGGINVGYADGHASWMASRSWVNFCGEEVWSGNVRVGLWGPPTWCGGATVQDAIATWKAGSGGEPTIYD